MLGASVVFKGRPPKPPRDPRTPGSIPGVISACNLSAISEHPDTRTAALEVAIGLGVVPRERHQPAALILLMASFHHSLEAFAAGAEIIGSHLQPQALIGGTAQTVFAGLDAPDRRSGLVAFALQGDDLTARAFHP